MEARLDLIAANDHTVETQEPMVVSYLSEEKLKFLAESWPIVGNKKALESDWVWIEEEKSYTSVSFQLIDNEDSVVVTKKLRPEVVKRNNFLMKRAQKRSKFILRFVKDYLLRMESMEFGCPTEIALKILLAFAEKLLPHLIFEGFCKPKGSFTNETKNQLYQFVGKFQKFLTDYNEALDLIRDEGLSPESLKPKQEQQKFLDYFESKYGKKAHFAENSKKGWKEQHQMMRPFFELLHDSGPIQTFMSWIDEKLEIKETEELRDEVNIQLHHLINHFLNKGVFVQFLLNLRIHLVEPLEGAREPKYLIIEDQEYYQKLGERLVGMGEKLLLITSDEGQLNWMEKLCITTLKQFPSGIGQRVWEKIQLSQYSEDEKLLSALENVFWKEGKPTLAKAFHLTPEKERRLHKNANQILEEQAKVLQEIFYSKVKDNIPAKLSWALPEDKIKSYLQNRCEVILQRLYRVLLQPKTLKLLFYHYLMQ